MEISEELLYYAWSMKSFDHADLKTTNGEKIEILSYGLRNHSSGPDFLQGKIIIDGILWVGNIEMHVRSGDWNKHSHSEDPAYNNVILHIVFTHDKAINDIPILVMKDIIHPAVISQYEALMQSAEWIPCAKIISHAHLERFPIWSHTMAIDRLAHKSVALKNSNAYFAKDWQQLMYQNIARYFGASQNMEVFQSLAERLPYSIIVKNRYNLMAVESMVFGIAGYLEQDIEDAYYHQLKSEFTFLQHKHNFIPLKKVEWRNFGMYAAGSPSFRLAQFAALIAQVLSIFDLCREAQSIEEIKNLLNVSINEYWMHHYNFGKTTQAIKSPHLSDDFKDRIMINAILPVLFVYAKEIGDDGLVDKCLDFLSSIRKEENAILNKWSQLNIKPKSALESQALIHLKTKYCDAKQCLKCPIGKDLLMQPSA
jgi:Protein of unknown function (DUF2851)